MRVLVDIVHPAHVHFYRHLIIGLREEGQEVEVVAREKDVTVALLRRFGIAHTTVGRSGHKGMIGQATELMKRDWALLKVARRFRPDVVLTRNPAGTHVARVVGATGIFDTDDGRQAGVHFRAAAPFAHVITTPDCLVENYGAKHRTYPSYKALAYLHPHRFQPDPSVLDDLGVSGGEPYGIARFVAMVASHDRAERGLPLEAKYAVVEAMAAAGPVFVSSESPLPKDLEGHRLPIAPDRLHDALAFASIYAGDSQTIAFEAGLLGTPSFRCSSWTGRLDSLEDLEHRYGLVRSFPVTAVGAFVAAVEAAVGEPGTRKQWQERRLRMLEAKVDLTAWYRDFLARVELRRNR